MKKILIIRLTSLGDVIFTVPLACAIKDNSHEFKVGWMVAEKGLGVVENNPCVDKVHFVPLKKWKKRPFSIKTFKEFFQIIKEVRREKYDIAFDCQQMFKNLFLFWFCGAKRRITFSDARELAVFAGNEFVKPKAKFTDADYHIVERNLDFARHIGISPNKIRFSLPDTTFETKQYIDLLISSLDKSKPMVVISPATTWQNKHWEEQNWRELILGIKDKCNLVFTGMEEDKPLIKRIVGDVIVDYIDLSGKTNIEQLRELFSRAKVIISPDSGSAHLAWATSIPSVVTLFTCTPKNRFGPYGNDEKYFSISSNLECQPCFKKKCSAIHKNACQKFPASSEIINIVNNLL